MTQDASSTGESTLQPQASVDPASVPLPHGEDRELQMGDIPEPPATSPESPPAREPRVDVPTSGVGVMEHHTQPLLQHTDDEPHAEVNPQQPVAPSESAEQVVPLVPSPSSTHNAESTPEAPAPEPHVDISTSEAGVIDHDAAEDDYVNVPPAKIDAAHPEGEGSEGHIKDDWELNF